MPFPYKIMLTHLFLMIYKVIPFFGYLDEFLTTQVIFFSGMKVFPTAQQLTKSKILKAEKRKTRYAMDLRFRLKSRKTIRMNIMNSHKISNKNAKSNKKVFNIKKKKGGRWRNPFVEKGKVIYRFGKHRVTGLCFLPNSPISARCDSVVDIV